MDKAMTEREAFVEWFINEARTQTFESVWIAACKWQREQIAEWIKVQRNDIPATGEEFAAAIRALPITPTNMVSYAHKDQPNGTRFCQYTGDTIPKWAVDIQPYSPTNTEGEQDERV